MTESLKHTPLHSRHVALGGKMVPFAGFEMPVQYPAGIQAEHRAVRSSVGVFDVSHMGEFFLTGPDALELIQKIGVNDASTLEVGQAQYSAMCREEGVVIDDLLVYRFEDRYLLVVNASNREKDLAWVKRHAEGLDVTIDDRSDEVALIAVQGPHAESAVRAVTDADLSAIGYYRAAEADVLGAEAIVSRTGYTGEDGFELYLPAERAEAVWDALFEVDVPGGIEPAGLGCRDSLRLEMGYALYGNDLDEEHTALESGLGWIVKLQKDDFIGRDALARQKEAGVSRRLVGMRLTDRGFPRAGYPIVSGGEEVGVVTSGVVSPSLGHGIAMGYVSIEHAKAGTEVAISIRGREIAATVQRPPFYTEGSIRR